LLEDCGFERIKPNHRFSQGVEVNFLAYDSRGGRWFFDVSGGFTSTRPGLKRTDTLWKALGKAAVLHEIHPETPLVLLTTDAPAPGGAGDAALKVVTGARKPIAAVLRMTSVEDQRQLHRFALDGPPERP
jgi:site-specific DNA-methyltransferase (adenine-specific)